MTDRREAIMLRLVAIAEQLQKDELVKSVARNELSFSDTRLPILSVLEGDEDIDPELDRVNRPSDRPQVVHMLPQIVIDLGEPRRTIGTELNVIRAAIIKAVMSDAQLQDRDHAGIKHCAHYHGMVSAFSAVARQMSGQYALRFLIKYWLEPSKL